MKNRQVTIEEYKNPLGANTITINNARYQKCFMNSIEKVFKSFLAEGELFFGFYRTDGLNLTLQQQKELEKVIPELFQRYGDIKNLNEYLSAARINSSDVIYNFIPSIFDYYLETILFNPKVDWYTFERYHYDYQKHRLDEIIINNFADVLFFYSDSGDFSICFNTEKYDHGEIRNLIEKAFLER